MLVDRAPVFKAVKALRNGQGFTLAEVHLLDAAIDEALGQIVVTAPRAPAVEIAPPAGRRIGARGLKLMHDFEGCRLDAYPDPGSHDGEPWTIGWGSTGPGIHKGVRWTQEQADRRFADDLAQKYGAALDKMLEGVPTTQNQYDAMLALTYNIGIGAFRGSSVLRLHKARDYTNAARAFLRWNKNGKPLREMRGLTRRRLAEADLYDDG